MLVEEQEATFFTFAPELPLNAFGPPDVDNGILWIGGDFVGVPVRIDHQGLVDGTHGQLFNWTVNNHSDLTAEAVIDAQRLCALILFLILLVGGNQARCFTFLRHL